MKNLYLLRHANTYPNTENDKERILTPKGVKEIKSIAKHLPDSEINAVLCSPAIRTKQTLHHLEDFLGKNFYTEFKESLYNPSIEGFITTIKETPDHFINLLVVSHNSSTSEVANYLLKNTNISFGTANIAKIELNIDHWSQLEAGCGTLKWLIKPDLL